MCVSSLRRGHANLLCIVPILSDVSKGRTTKVKQKGENFKLEENLRKEKKDFLKKGQTIEIVPIIIMKEKLAVMLKKKSLIN